MEDGLEVAAGDIVLFLDGDLRQICDDLVERMTAPIISGKADLVKAKFSRDAGRVTILTARPLLSAFFPELNRFDQPLGGIVAARRSLLSSLRLENDYGIDVGLLIDATMKGTRVVEVDIGRIDHESQSLGALGDMAKQVTRVILDRAWRYDRLSINLVREMEETERRVKAELLPIACHPGRERKYALLDMDGVLVDGRFIVELAERVDAKHELLRFLDSKMLPDEERTRAIASLFTGVPWEVFAETARSLPLMEGAVETVVALRRAGYVVGILTDSFQVAAEIVRRRVFADFSVAHLMRFRNGRATGELTLSPVMLNPDGCPEHHCCKSNVVRRLRESVGLIPEHTLAVGDSDNDICMLREVGLSIAFRPKSVAVEMAAKYALSHSLTGVLDLLGIGRTGPRIPKISSRRQVSISIPPVLAEKAG